MWGRITGGFDLSFQPQGREIDYWLGQIPTISPPSLYWWGGYGLTLIGALEYLILHTALAVTHKPTKIILQLF